MSEGRARKRRWVPLLAACVAAAVLIAVLWVQFEKLRSLTGPETSGGTSGGIAPNRPRRPVAQARPPKEVPRAEFDLEGQREPTEQELIRFALLRYLDEIRAASWGNTEKLLAVNRNKALLRELIRSLPPSAVPIIAELLRNESDFVCRRVLIYGLADMGTDKAAAVLRDYFLARIGDENYGSEMRHVVRALGQCDAQYAFETLKDFLLDAENAAVAQLRPRYVEAMGQHRLGYQAVPLFFDLVHNDFSDEVRNEAAQALKHVAKREVLSTRKVLPSLIESFEAEGARQRARERSVPYVKQTLLGAAGQLGDPAAVPWLLEVGTTESFPVRLSAAAALARIGGPEALAALREVYANSSRKAELVDAMGQLKEPKVLPFLIEVAVGAESEALKHTALRGIWRVGGPEAAAALQQILTTEGISEGLRKQVQRQLAHLPGRRS